ncbi:ypgQ [Cucurbita argyrosperma subsp. argyrosperma]|nr:ypgQ [Cucurbita argyrosperma subsp. argyrosperma]
MARRETVKKAEELVEMAMGGNDASHDPSHVWRVRDLALSLAEEEGLSSKTDSMEIVELAALLHDIGDYKYLRDPSEEKVVEDFLEEEGIEDNKKQKILAIIKGMGFKEEIAGLSKVDYSPEFGRALHNPAIRPRTSLSKEAYMNKEEQTTVNHFHEKLLKIKDMMKTKAGQRRAEKRHKFMEEFLKEFYDEWDQKA